VKNGRIKWGTLLRNYWGTLLRNGGVLLSEYLVVSDKKKLYLIDLTQKI
jgi:hypothetical protein